MNLPTDPHPSPDYREFDTGGAPHVAPEPTVSGVMRQVLYALLPGVAAMTWFFGPGVLLQIAIALISGLAFEFWMLRLRGRPVRQYLGDFSVVITAVLFALCLPPLTPVWVGVLGMFFAVVIAKHLYGGLGHNVFNPAMVGYVAMLVAFPQAMTAWLPPQSLMETGWPFSQTLLAIATGQAPLAGGWDAVTQATPLDTLKTGIEQGRFVEEIRAAPIFGDFGGLGWEWVANFYLLGGFWLLYKRIISWHVPVAVLGSVLLISLPAYLVDPGANPIPLQHIFSGGLVLGAFFIATDPVSGCSTPRGKLIFGLGVGIITLVIRRWGGYPDGVAFGVLLMNMAAPFIDRYTRPRVYGHPR